MTFLVDDRAHAHPKFAGMKLDVWGFWCKCGSRISGFPKINGYVSVDTATEAAGSEERARQLGAELVRRHLWTEADGGWIYHDWADYRLPHPDADQLVSLGMAELGRLGGIKSGEARRGSKRSLNASQSGSNASEPGSLFSDLSGSSSLPPSPSPSSSSGSLPKDRNGHEGVSGTGSLFGEEALASGPDMVVEAFEHWLKHWKEKIKGNRAPALTPDRDRVIRKRLADGYTVADLKLAIDACWASEWHVQNRHFDIELICRNSTKLDGFLAMHGRPSASQVKPKGYWAQQTAPGVERSWAEAGEECPEQQTSGTGTQAR